MDIGILLIIAVIGQTPGTAAPRPSEVAPPTSPKPGGIRFEEIVGKVREISGGPAGRAQALLLSNDGRQLILHPVRQAEAPELIRLSGLRVKLRAGREPGLPGPNHVRVLSYRIVDVGGGVTPRIGHIARFAQNGRTRLLFVDQAGRADMLPAGWTEKLRAHVGAKVWMAGRTERGVFSPTRFAILRPVAKKGDSP